MSKVVALEAGAHGVTSNCINAGKVRTPLVPRPIADQARAYGIPEEEVSADI
jgi:3-hydroxybutyrate dehydrogenase